MIADPLSKPFDAVLVLLGTAGDLPPPAEAAETVVTAHQLYPRATLTLGIDGYDDDPREVIDIPEARAFYAGLAEALATGPLRRHPRRRARPAIDDHPGRLRRVAAAGSGQVRAAGGRAVSPPRRWWPGKRSRFAKRSVRAHTTTPGLTLERRAAMAAIWSARSGMAPELWLGPVLEPIDLEPEKEGADPTNRTP